MIQKQPGAETMRTQVGIIGAGPAGLALARILHLQGTPLSSSRTAAAIISRTARAGLIEHWAADLLTDLGVGERMKREGLVHWALISPSTATFITSISRRW